MRSGRDTILRRDQIVNTPWGFSWGNLHGPLFFHELFPFVPKFDN